MNVKQALLDAGFNRIIALDGAPYGGGTLLLAFWYYVAEKTPSSEGAWVPEGLRGGFWRRKSRPGSRRGRCAAG